ncbi:MAG: ATP-binding protein [Deltaproteobacteria bacterium]|jgi:hypothetical protein|nr:ATP-binding protein [Deltaproteobacteria bacterium]
MTKILKKLPIEVSDFKSVIEKNFVYADKTDLLYNLITYRDNVKSFFLSRPRRFGKSLLLDTLSEIFNGDRNLFKGLKIDDTDYDFQKYPVLIFNMNVSSDSPETLKLAIVDSLRLMLKKENLKLESTTPTAALQELLEGVYHKYKKNIVVLIDEYDDAVSSNIDNEILAKENSKILRTFYSGFKTYNRIMRFAFVTGVTRYAMMGISAGFNYLTDITLKPEYSTICGFTPEELDLNFSERYPLVLNTLNEKGYLSTKLWSSYISPKLVQSQDKANIDDQAVRIWSDLKTVEDLKTEILNWYDGYSWDGKNYVLNPVAVMKFFHEAAFEHYWEKTNPSTNIITKLLKTTPFEFTMDKLQSVLQRDILDTEVGELKPVPLFFQTGYLTVNNVTCNDGEYLYSFKVPNLELKKHFYSMLNNAIFKRLTEDNDKIQIMSELKKALFSKDGETLTGIMSAYFAGMPPVLQSRLIIDDCSLEAKPNYNEHFFHQLLWSLFWSINPKTRAEEPGATGTPDLIVPLNDTSIAVIEIKYDKTTNTEEANTILNKLAIKALDAIKKKKYGENYKLPWNNVISIGVGVCGRGDVLALFGDTAVNINNK